MRRLVVLLMLLITAAVLAVTVPTAISTAFADNGVLHGNTSTAFADNGVISSRD
jgi:hypothetical protein